MGVSDSGADSVRLAHSPQGAVYYCCCCQRLRLDYKNISIPDSWENLLSFTRILEQKYLNLSLSTDASAALISMRVAGLWLRFSAQEVDELLELMRKAQIEMQRLRLERIFQQKACEERFSSEI